MHNKSWLWFAAGLLVSGTLGAAQGPQFGQPLAGLPPDVLALFEAGQEEFEAAADVGKGLGPVFNDVSSGPCHSNPKVGGDSNITETRFGRITKGAFDPMTERGGSLLQVRGVDPGRGCGPGIVPPEAPRIAKPKTR